MVFFLFQVLFWIDDLHLGKFTTLHEGYFKNHDKIKGIISECLNFHTSNAMRKTKRLWRLHELDD